MPLPPSPRRGRLLLRERLAAQVVGQQQVGGHRRLPTQRRAHGEEVAGRGDVVDAQHVRAAIEAVRDRGQRAGQPLARRAARERADEVLARDREQDRQAQSGSSSRRRSSSIVWAGSLPRSGPGHTSRRSSGTPAARATSSRSLSSRLTSSTTSS